MDADRAALAEENVALKAELAVARAKASEDAALIVQQTLRIAKLERQVYGQKSERSARLIDQLALTFEELEANATEDELAAEQAVAKTTTVVGFTRKRAERNTFPDHLPRERVVIDPPTACECCGGNRLRKLGEDVILRSGLPMYSLASPSTPPTGSMSCCPGTGRLRNSKASRRRRLDGARQQSQPRVYPRPCRRDAR